ncbi:hypothetical protein SARC_06994 [Sphaeroforma arctica JP610]|uniref:Methyltransferase domain-containing protein n=1 Tax=Sphaeroforma arctica JP610 TaxID=667725 RepID=A0A0L0FVJ5_9EUKA|nr:hypothetical protein SARC_06994 [Sphaeroforma arctica JP610]KNC80654.1 hypothetical protein SARC_06994 [Sphaeroforma arctica JP610]|eukprot:XP_014154556.1 hypothetical protein SARC_06994 [Sphaeroforma arctica JP610]
MEFQRIYTDNVWEGNRGIGGTGGGGSGDGSNPAMIRNLPKIMEDVINKYNVLKWLDAPCGRVRWTSKFLKEQQTKRLSEGKPELQYLGLDVVGSVIKMNTEEFWDEAAWTFELKDLETEAIPQGYDLILCRDALQHLPLKTALRGKYDNVQMYPVLTAVCVHVMFMR